MDLLRVAMDAIEAMTVLRNRRILSVFAAVSYPRQYCNNYLWTNKLQQLYRKGKPHLLTPPPTRPAVLHSNTDPV